MPAPPGRGASLPHAVSRAFSRLVRGGAAGGVHHRLSVGPGEANYGETELSAPRVSAWPGKRLTDLCVGGRAFIAIVN